MQELRRRLAVASAAILTVLCLDTHGRHHRPKLVRFLDEMRRDKSMTRIDEVDIGEHSSFAGRSLREMDIRKATDLLVLAVRVPNEDGYTYNPGAEFILEAGMTLVVLGPIHQVDDLRKQADSRPAGEKNDRG